LLSGVPQELYGRALAQHLEGRFKSEIAQGEQLDNEIAEAEAGLEIARGDVSRAAELPADEFAKLVESINTKRNAVWLKRDVDINGNEAVYVAWPLEGNVRRIATPDDLRNGKYYRDFAEYQADRAA
jgi:hypothetical protein